MFRLFLIVAVVVFVGAGSAWAADGCCSSACCNGVSSAPVASAPATAGTQSRRSYSYEPSTSYYGSGGYRSYSSRGTRGYNRGPSYLDATAKSRGY